MGQMTDEPDPPVKLLLIGNSGGGKTGALIALAKAGFQLVIADFDNGLDIFRTLGRGQDWLSNVNKETYTDELKAAGAHFIPVSPSKLCFPRFLKHCDKWPDFGVGIQDFPSNYIFVLDSLSFMGGAALRQVLAANGRSLQQPWQSDWGEAMSLCEGVLSKLYSTRTKCNVIVTSHVSFIEQEGAPLMGFPSALGKKLPPKIGRYFNSMLLCKSVPGSSRRKIMTVSDGITDLKCPVEISKELKQETGLLDFFVAMGASPKGEKLALKEAA